MEEFVEQNPNSEVLRKFTFSRKKWITISALVFVTLAYRTMLMMMILMMLGARAVGAMPQSTLPPFIGRKLMLKDEHLPLYARTHTHTHGMDGNDNGKSGAPVREAFDFPFHY